MKKASGVGGGGAGQIPQIASKKVTEAFLTIIGWQPRCGGSRWGLEKAWSNSLG